METVRRGASESIVFGLKSTKKSTKVVKKTMAYLFGNCRPLVLRRLENIVVARWRSTPPPTPYFLRARREKQLLTVLSLAYPPLRPERPFLTVYLIVLGGINFCHWEREKIGSIKNLSFIIILQTIFYTPSSQSHSFALRNRCNRYRAKW